MSESFILTRKKLAEQIEVAKALRPRKLEINSALGFRGRRLDFLRELPWVTELSIVLVGEVDWAPILSLTELEYLHVDGPFALDLSSLPALRKLSATWDPSQSLDRCRALSGISISKFRGDLSYFSGCEQLEELVLTQPRMGSCKGLHSPNLLEFRIQLPYGPLDLEGITGAANLVHLAVRRCRSVTGLAHLGDLAELHDLTLVDIRSPLEDVAALVRPPKLQALNFVGTKIRDGDLSELERLKWVAFDNSPDYSTTEAELDDVLRPRGGGAVLRDGDFELRQADLRRWRAEVSKRHGLSNWMHEHRPSQSW